MIRLPTIVAGVIVLLATLTFSSTALAASETYTYDALGRLVTYVDAQGVTTQYTYDAAGNITGVAVNVSQQPPTVASVTPSSLRRGSTNGITIAGANLANVTITSSDAGLTFTNLIVTATQVTLTLAVGSSVPLGAAKLTLTRASATAEANIAILPALPTLSVAPLPIAVPPDNVPKNVSLSLSHADTVAHTVAVAVNAAEVATIAPASVTFAPGEVAKSLQITGKAAGQTVANFTSSNLTAIAVPIFVTAEFRGLNTTYAPLVGVVLGTQGGPPTSSFTSTLPSPHVGVILGSHLAGLNPDRVSVGNSYTVTATGAGMTADSTVTILPSDGLTVGAPTVGADGNSLAFTVAVAPNAPTTLRHVTVTAGSQRLAPRTPGADRLLVTSPMPEVTGISPIAGTFASTINPFRVYGRNLHGGSVSFSGAGITAGSSPAVNAEGTELTTSLAISVVAPIGPQVVTVQTPAGTSSSTGSPANTFTVVSEIVSNVSPVLAPLVGVNLEGGSTPPVSRTYQMPSPNVGVIFGSAIFQAEPGFGAQGTTANVVLTGQAIPAGAVIGITPSDGLTIGSTSVSGDGTTASVQVEVAAAAPLTLRRISITANNAEIGFAEPLEALFAVVAPAPTIESVTPNVIGVGASAVPVTVRGTNFQSAQQVKVTPFAGVTMSAPVSQADGTSLVVNVTVAAGAAAGNRVLSVVTPAGETSLVESAANRLALVAGSPVTYTPIVSQIVGVQVGTGSTGTSFNGLLASPLVGVSMGEITQPPRQFDSQLHSGQVGVTLGAVAYAVNPNAVVQGGSASITLNGANLPADAAVTIVPPDNLTVGVPAVAGDGNLLTVTIEAIASAALGPREVRLASGATTILFAERSSATLLVTPGVPFIESLTPILARQGETVTLTIRGGRFNDLQEVTIEPPEGIVFGAAPALSEGNAVITLGLQVLQSAPVGSRVVRVRTAGGISTNAASPANTFTIFTP